MGNHTICKDLSQQRKRRKKNIRKTLVILSFIAPALLFYLTFIVFPVGESIVLSFFKVKIFARKATYEFIGFENLRTLFTDEVFWKAAKNTVIWAFASPLLEIPIALLLAYVLHSGVRRNAFFRIAWFAPVLFPAVVVGIIWSWIYNSQWGLLNAILETLHLGALIHPWLGDPATALPSLIVTSSWMWTGFNMVILLAAISSIPKDVFEAGRIDGASNSTTIFQIVIPMIRPTIINLMILCFVGKMKVFDLIWATTQGGPMWATETVATYTVKRAFFWGTFEKGYPSAMATFWFFIILAVSIVTTIALQRKESLEY